MTTHTYSSRLLWTGSTAAGYQEYSRDHRIAAPPAVQQLDLSADPAFLGDSSRLNPEQLLVMAASSCQMLSTLGAAVRSGLTVLSYEDDAEGFMDDAKQAASIERISLNPTITVPAGTDHSQVEQVAEQAHRTCYIANSLRSEVTLTLHVVEAGAGA